MGSRHLGRELALKALYQIDIRGGATSDDLALFFANFPSDDRSRKFATELLEGVRRNIETIDRYLDEVVEHWNIRRLSRIDHNILRLAIFELIGLDEIPARVSMDEAIELAKRYGDKDSGRFVNGVLDQLAERLNLRNKGEADKSGKIQ
jgi:transcription antitermination factor NusB